MSFDILKAIQTLRTGEAADLLHVHARQQDRARFGQAELVLDAGSRGTFPDIEDVFPRRLIADDGERWLGVCG